VSMLFVSCATFLQMVAESFPVSSSGHLALLDQLWSKLLAFYPEYQRPWPWSETIFWERYIDILHVVPLIVIAWYFYPRWRVFLFHPLRTWRIAVKLIGYVLLADGVTAVLYCVRPSLFFSTLPLWVGFSATALLLVSLFFVPRRKVLVSKNKESVTSLGDTCSSETSSDRSCSDTTYLGADLTVSRALLLGLFQGLALLPGLSRFAATFCGGRYLGFSARSSFEISFMLQWPLILAAVARSGLFFMHHNAGVVVTPLLVAVILASALLAWLGFCYAARLAHTERLWYCAFYVAVVAIAALLV
jgi:undecaprenyl pyrophosphate phosphatase UppP